MATHLAPILINEQLHEDVFRLSFRCEPVAGQARAGQFLHVRVSPRNDPLLRRPLSIHDVDRASGSVQLLYQVVGSGTQALASRTPGELIDCMGPLGRPFQPQTDREIALLVAGGIGIAPFPLLVRTLLGAGKQVTVLAGWRTSRSLVGVKTIEELGVPVEVASEDGLRGFPGTAIDLLRDRLARQPSLLAEAALYACGPKAMLIKVGELAESSRIPCQISLEERMACGIGACHGCAVADRHNPPRYKLVCRDGPVFRLDEVALK